MKNYFLCDNDMLFSYIDLNFCSPQKLFFPNACWLVVCLIDVVCFQIRINKRLIFIRADLRLNTSSDSCFWNASCSECILYYLFLWPVIESYLLNEDVHVKRNWLTHFSQLALHNKTKIVIIFVVKRERNSVNSESYLKVTVKL